MEIRMTFDSKGDVAYLMLVPQIAWGEVKKTINLPWQEVGFVNIDLDSEDMIVAIEIFAASKRFRVDLLSQALARKTATVISHYDPKLDTLVLQFTEGQAARSYADTRLDLQLDFDSGGRLLSLKFARSTSHLRPITLRMSS
jgi:uncharacterized protein YuzE